MVAREEKLETLVEEIERKLTLVGSSGTTSLQEVTIRKGCFDTYLALLMRSVLAAVEDKLQEGVPETISLFQKAGIKVHVKQMGHHRVNPLRRVANMSNTSECRSGYLQGTSWRRRWKWASSVESLLLGCAKSFCGGQHAKRCPSG